jgi:hypothetical protein
VKTNLDGVYGEIVPNVGGTVGGNYNVFWTDYYYTDIASSSLRGVFVGGDAYIGTNAGFVCFYSNRVPSGAVADVGSRLAFIP